MTNFIPVFPLGIVVYPNELVNLHIFEPRYKQLIADCVNEQKAFGMATVINGQLQDFGYTVRVTKITKTYDNGEMDLTIQGHDVIKILDFVNEIPNKMYGGAIVNYPENSFSCTDGIFILHKVKIKLAEVFAKLKIQKKHLFSNGNFLSYYYAHYIGLTLKQEYEVLTILTEAQRLDFIVYFLQEMVNNSYMLKNVQDKVKLNGHFRLNK